jgi:hypothetical protein
MGSVLFIPGGTWRGLFGARYVSKLQFAIFYPIRLGVLFPELQFAIFCPIRLGFLFPVLTFVFPLGVFEAQL